MHVCDECVCDGLQVCFRLTYYQGRAGLVGVDAVVGHSSASLGPPDKALKKSKAKPSKRKAANQKAGTTTQQAGSTACLLFWKRQGADRLGFLQ